MSTKLLPKDKQEYRWKFPEDKDDKDACIFHIKLRTNRNRIESNLLRANRLIESDEDFANSVYGENIVKVENVDGEVLTEQKDIVKFCLDRLSEAQGSALQLAIQGIGEYFDEGLVKN